MNSPFTFRDTGEGCWTVEDLRDEQRTPAGTLLADRGRVVRVFLGETAQEVAESCVDLLNEEVAR